MHTTRCRVTVMAALGCALYLLMPATARGQYWDDGVYTANMATTWSDTTFPDPPTAGGAAETDHAIGTFGLPQPENGCAARIWAWARAYSISGRWTGGARTESSAGGTNTVTSTWSDPEVQPGTLVISHAATRWVSVQAHSDPKTGQGLYISEAVGGAGPSGPPPCQVWRRSDNPGTSYASTEQEVILVRDDVPLTPQFIGGQWVAQDTAGLTSNFYAQGNADAYGIYLQGRGDCFQHHVAFRE